MIHPHGFLESIRLKDSHPTLISYHQERINRTAEYFGFDAFEIPCLSELCPVRCREGVTKCRLLYNSEGLERIEFESYSIRLISTLQLVNADETFDYSFKYADRSALNALINNVQGADEIIIVREGKYISDCSFANLALLKDGLWYTPNRPLLAGVQRAFLIDEGRLIPKDIIVDDLQDYEGLKLINAMLPLDESPLINIVGIRGFST